MEIYIILTLVWLHFFADFILQTDYFSLGKSKNNWILTGHVLMYILPFIFAFSYKFVIINFVLHWITDYISSRATTVLWQAGERHWFFVVIGLDQAVHLTCLILTYALLPK